MKYSTYQYGVAGTKWGIWDSSRKQFVSGICEDTPMLAKARLHQKIGNSARKWRFEIKRIPKERQGRRK